MNESVYAHCRELLCIQYYKLGQFDNVWRWNGYWKEVAFIRDEELRRALHQDCLLA